MREYKWDRATITPDEIVDGLVSQYGPECPISIEMDDRKKQIPYKNAMATCECHRCGSVFSMTPASILNAFYNTGYVCLKCGPLSDDQMKAKQKERMNERALEELEKHGVDVFAEDEDEKKAKQEAEEDNRVAMSSEDYQDAFDELDEDNQIVESTESSEVVEEEISEEEDDVSKYMASDDDDKVSIGESASVDVEEETEVPSEEPEIVDYSNYTPVNHEAERLEEEKTKAIEEAKKEAELEKQKAVEEAKQEAIREAQRKADEEKAAYADKLRAEMEAEMKAKIEAEKAKAAAEIEAAKKAQEEAEKFAAEANLKAQEAQEALEAMESDEEPIVSEEADYEDDQTEEYTEEDEDGVEENFTLDETSDEEQRPTTEEEYFDHVVGTEGYSQDEFDAIVEKRLSNIKDKLSLQPWVRASFDTDDDGHITATCRLCGQKNVLDSFDDIDNVVTVDDAFCKTHNIKIGKLDRKDGKTPMMSTCACCRESIINNGFNEYHRNAVEGLAHESHFKVLNGDNHLFIPSLDEIFTVECNGVKADLTFAELCGFNGKDAREDPMFKAPEKSVSDEQHRVIKPVSKNTEVKTEETQATKNKTVTLKAEAPSKEDYEANKTQAKGSVFKKSEKTQQQTMYNKYNMGPKVENMTDSNASLEEEREIEQEEIVKNTIFKPGQKLVISRKNIAKLNNKQNPFEREEALEEQFRETKMARFISDLSTESEVKCNLIINNKTYELPVIDFESGLRVICADLEERSMPNVPFNTLGDPKVLPFTYYESTATDDGTGVFKKRPKKFNWVVLFSDSVEERHDATFMALMKYVNPKKLAYEGQRIQLEDNLNYEYTTYDQFLRDFDVRYSPFPGGKPKTGQLGILATWDSSKAVTTKDVLKFQLQASGMDNVANLNSLEDESQYMVASIRYIERFNKETNRVIYTITEYVEIGSCLIADGLAQCIRALLKEYMLKYPAMRNVEPYIIVECDPNSLTSPSIKNYLKRGSIVAMNDTIRQLIYGSQFRPGRNGVDQYLRYSYVRRPEYRSKDSDYLRHDMRMFSVGTIIRTMSDEIKQAGIQNTIRDPDVKNRFIANMGYVKARQAEIKEMFVTQSTVTSLLYDSKTTLMRKHINADGNMFQNTAMVTDSMSGIGMNNIFTNPNLINRYQRIMERGTPEAKQHMLNLMYQSNPMMAAQIQMMGGMGMMSQPNMQQNNFGMPQMNYWFTGNNFGN